ncbi:MAG: hypothetical protein M1830_009564 [Pleopsidium flavum]|nr:MAG: hypothetical protein M1830_000763 [Pleopsidium flavum]KAI9879111.1 MAG: hypothetical protein M1830_009564 [Pleopsidium flavum]
MDSSKTEGRENKEEVQPPPTEGSSSTKLEARAQDASEAVVKKACKKHHLKPRKSGKKRALKKEISSSSDSSSDSSSSSSEDESDEVDSSPSDESQDEAARKKRKSKARRRAKKLKEKRKARSKKQTELSSESSDEDSTDESSSDGERSKKARKVKKRKAKKAKKAAKTSLTVAEEDGDPMARARAQLNALGLRGMGGRRAAGGRTVMTDRDSALKSALSGKLPGKSKSSKKKKASKVAFIRVDQLWDSSLHNYKLTETAEDHNTDDYDQYIFTVRRNFDWENKYTDTVVDIKSNLLKEALNHVMKGVRGVSLVETTPVVDPNMLFLYLEELRAYMKELRVLRKAEPKRKSRKAADMKASHVKGRSSHIFLRLDNERLIL